MFWTYILGVFICLAIVFYLLGRGIIDDWDEEVLMLAIAMAVLWPLSLPTAIVCAVFYFPLRFVYNLGRKKADNE